MYICIYIIGVHVCICTCTLLILVNIYFIYVYMYVLSSSNPSIHPSINPGADLGGGGQRGPAPPQIFGTHFSLFIDICNSFAKPFIEFILAQPTTN